MVLRRLAILSLAVAAGSCSAYGGGEAVGFAIVSSCVKVRTPMERTFASLAEWQAFVTANGGTSTVPPELASRTIAARFDGQGSACVGFSVDSVRDEDGRIIVRAFRHTSPDPCVAVVAYPQLVLALDDGARDQPVEFRITDRTDRAQGQTPPCI